MRPPTGVHPQHGGRYSQKKHPEHGTQSPTAQSYNNSALTHHEAAPAQPSTRT